MSAAEPLLQAVASRRDRIDATRPIFIGAASRSGTTLLGAMLGVGPDVLTVPEAPFKDRLSDVGHPGDAGVHGDLAARHALQVLRDDWKFRLWDLDLPDDPPPGVRVAYADLLGHLVLRYGEGTGKPSPAAWVDHTPTNLQHAVSLAQRFPRSRFVHLVRDGRACTASWLPLDWGPNDPHEAAASWTRSIAFGLAAEQALGPSRVVRVRYEDLVRDPVDAMKVVCDGVDLPFDEAMLHRRDYRVSGYTADQHRAVARPPDPTRVDAWRQRLSRRDVEIFEAYTGDLLAALGYEPLVGFGARVRRKPEHLRDVVAGTARRLLVNRANQRLRRRRHGSG